MTARDGLDPVTVGVGGAAGGQGVYIYLNPLLLSKHFKPDEHEIVSVTMANSVPKTFHGAQAV